jgi:hypothetical protein
VTLKMHATILRTGRPPGEYDALLHVNLEFWKVLHCWYRHPKCLVKSAEKCMAIVYK